MKVHLVNHESRRSIGGLRVHTVPEIVRHKTKRILNYEYKN